jgi:outer membrane protein assembly factor BamD
LGQAYEGEIEIIRKNGRMNEVTKGKMIDELLKDAAETYGKIIKRYPAMDRAVDAKARLEALHQPVPRPTRAMLEQNKKEVASRQPAGMVSTMLGNFEKHPDVAKAAHVGDPTMIDPAPVTATDVVKKVSRSAMGGGDSKVTVETTDAGTAGATSATASDPAVATVPGEPGAAPDPAAAAAELKPTPADPNELKPNVEAAEPNALPPLQQSNQMDNGGTSNSSSSSASSSTAAKDKDEELADISSSKKKKKKGVAKLNPF